MKALNRNFFILLLCLNSLMVLGQSKAPSEPKVLDNAILRVTYAFSQQAEKQREKVTLTDTMTLDAGSNWSLYYNLNKIRKDSLNKERERKLMSTVKTVSIFKDNDALEKKLESRQEPSIVTDESRNGSARLYKYRSENQIILIDYGPSENLGSPIRTYLKVTEDFNPKNWKMSEETRKILD